MGKLAGRIWVSCTTLLISFIGFTSQIWIVGPAYGSLFHPDCLRVLVPFNIGLAILFYNYFACVRTDPGGVPRGWKPDPKEEEDGAVEVKRLSGGPRYCRTCKEFKPPRAHHCRKCNKCVLKMDHHCPWVNNCVGHHNHGHFIRFLFWVDVCCSYHLWMITSRAFKALSSTAEPKVSQVVMIILNYTACVPVLFAVGLFSLFHFWSVGSNTTTIEGWEKDKVAVLKRKGKIREFKYPYNLGVYKNFQSVLGKNPLFWCWPQAMRGTGLRYSVRGDMIADVQYSWPPRDEFSQREKLASRSEVQYPFTYGEERLNPNLLPSSSTTLRNRLLKRHNASPYHPDFDEPLPDETRPLSESESDDDVPLGRIAARRAHANPAAAVPLLPRLPPSDLNPPPAIRVRRGSEGYEVRPANLVAERPELSDSSWDHWEDGYGSEVDEDGDRVRRGPRYRVYRREEDDDSESSEEFTDSEDEGTGSTNSVDEYLDGY